MFSMGALMYSGFVYSFICALPLPGVLLQNVNTLKQTKDLTGDDMHLLAHQPRIMVSTKKVTAQFAF